MELHHVPRAENEAADTLSKLGATRKPIPPGIFLQHLHEPTVREDLYIDPTAVQDDEAVNLVQEVMVVNPHWTLPYIIYLFRKELPKNEVEAWQIVHHSKAYTILNDELYKASPTSISQRCISLEEGRKILNEIHSGTCGHHASSQALVAKAFRAYFFWLTTLADAVKIVRTCIGCHKYAHQSHMPAFELKTISIALPFAQWGLDMVGLQKTAKEGFTHFLVAVDKFTK